MKLSSGNIIVKLVVALFLLLTFSAAGYLYWQHQNDIEAQQKLLSQVSQLNTKLDNIQAPATPVLAASPTPQTPSPVPTPLPTPTAANGTIQGKLSYPSEAMPKQRICAVNQDSKTEVCTETYQGNIYKLTVPAGTYQVYATLSSAPENSQFGLKSKAYYSEFVTCGLKYGCPSHKPIDVVVKTGETVQNIDPGDWYANQ